MKRKALGKGLSSLIPSSLSPQAATSPASPPSSVRPFEFKVEVSKIRPNPRQPRQTFDEAGLEELARSLKTQGVLQPVVVRPAANGAYELVAGERRWRAAQRAGIHQIPAIVRDVSDANLLQLALIENLQREELNAIEEAEAYRILIDDLQLTQGEIAEHVGKQRATVANSLRLLALPRKVQDLVRSRQLSMGHARALLALEDPKLMESLAERIVKDGLSVREVEARAHRGEAVALPIRRAGKSVDPNVAAAEETLQRAVGTRVRIRGSAKSGRVELHYRSSEELDRLYTILTKGR
ncbi:MAG TPA: ParB/RepB/Spo0J family partition protein [Candidatus Polarisedimenticolaceae bacterium]|nr:ParB/RepB/Spo0J family partition protein [Candidatus Polarisedimenticolaceae bacterium]